MLSPFYRWRYWGSEKLHGLPEVTQLVGSVQIPAICHCVTLPFTVAAAAVSSLQSSIKAGLLSKVYGAHLHWLPQFHVHSEFRNKSHPCLYSYTPTDYAGHVFLNSKKQSSQIQSSVYFLYLWICPPSHVLPTPIVYYRLSKAEEDKIGRREARLGTVIKITKDWGWRCPLRTYWPSPLFFPS